MKTRLRRISRRSVSMLLAVLMMVSVLGFGSLITASAADPTGFTSGSYVYYVPSSDWVGSSARCAAYFYGDGTAWSSVITSQTEGTRYRLQVPGTNKSFTHVIFVRLNNTATSGSWDVDWNQTGDLAYDKTKNCYTITGYGGGSWGTYTETSSATLSASPSTITTDDTSTLSPGISGNTTYNDYKSVEYEIDPDNGASIDGNTFSATATGTYTVTATVTYNAKGFPGATATATQTASITVNPPACAPVLKTTGGDDLGATKSINENQILKFKTDDPSGHTTTYSVYKDGSTKNTASTYLNKYKALADETEVTFTPTAAGSYVIEADCSGGGKDSVTVTVTYIPITPAITYQAKKNDDGTGYIDGGGTITAKEIEFTAGTPGTGTATYLYLWWSGSNNPEQHSNKVNAVKGTDNYYYGSFSPTGNFYFNITDSSSSATAGTQKLDSSTKADVGAGFSDWTTVGNWGSYYIGKGYLSSGDTVYIKYDPSGNKVYFRNTSFTYTIAGVTGGTPDTETEIKTLSASGDTITYNHRVQFTASESAGYKFVGWYSDSTLTTRIGTEKTYTTADLTDNYAIYAAFEKQEFITLYNSYQYTNGKYVFVAAPPRRVEIGTGETKRTFVYSTGDGTQRGQDYVLYESGTYYEGNKLSVYPGETIKLTFNTLASSDAIKGVFFNNARRYTTEMEDDNLYYRGEYKEGGWGSKERGYASPLTGIGESVPDDDWEYTFNSDTTLFADEGYYTDKTDIITDQKSGYQAQAGMNQTEHTLTWTATKSYLNIDIQLAYKYQIHFNNDDTSGIKIEGMNDEGYYNHGESFETKAFKISVDNTTDTTANYSFNDFNVEYLDKDGNPVSQPTGMAITAKKSDGTTVSSAEDIGDISYFLVTGVMPSQNVYVKLPLLKTYKMSLANIVVSDSGDDSRKMLTECSTNSTSATDCIGSITAIPKKGDVTGLDISSDGTYYTYRAHDNANTVSAYDDSDYNKYLKGGVNRGGSDVEDGSVITYTFTFNSGKDALYSFVGWYEGSYDGNGKFTVDYNKKLSGKTSFPYTPKKNTVVIAVGTRDIYLGGNFTNAGAFSSDSSTQTWKQSRIRMEYDPTYVKPGDATKIGRYYYNFNTVSANEEYLFRCYDTVGDGAAGAEVDNVTVWKTWSGDEYAQNNEGIHFGRDKDGTDAVSRGQFMYRTNTTSHTLTGNDADNKTSTTNHQSNGYAAPVTVYFYAYDGGIGVESTYQWSQAYVSAGRGIDVLSVDATKNPVETTYNVPTVSVANKTVNDCDVAVTEQTAKYGAEKGRNNKIINKYETIYECTVKERDGQIKVTACPNDSHVELQAFLVYNIDTKESEAVLGPFTEEGTDDDKTYTGNITVPVKSKLYIVPIYKFTQAFIDNPDGNSETDDALETHIVYVRADDLDKDDWGGLVSMYSWGTTQGYDSGGWPGQLMIPSDDGTSFYAPLTFKKNGLAGVTFSNYTQVWGEKFINFLGTYQAQGVSDTQYSCYTSTTTPHVWINQAFDYREPISIIDNINAGDIYDSEDVDLTFALKMGNKNAGTVGNDALNTVANFEYLTDRSGKYRVDLNGNKLSNSATATYFVVCSYTEDYKPGGSKSYDFKDGTRDGTSTHNRYSIEWTVYDNENNKIGSKKLSAAYTDVYKNTKTGNFTYIAKMLDTYGYPITGKAVKIAYENPKESSLDNTEAKRFSGQWYADGVNSLIEGNVRVGILSDGVYMPSDSNAQGYATATVGVKDGSGVTIPNAITNERFVQEDGCSGNSLVQVTKTHANKSNITFSVDTTTNFLGWYRDDGEGGYEPIGTNYKNQTINPSFNNDITYYAFYQAAASYVIKYTNRKGQSASFTAQGSDLTAKEMANGGTLDKASRAENIKAQLAQASLIKVFNRDISISVDPASMSNSKPYTIEYTVPSPESTYTLQVYCYNSSGSLYKVGQESGTWSTELDVTNDIGDETIGKGTSKTINKPSGGANKVFIGWKKYTGGALTGEILSTRANFGYSITEDMSIAPYFGTREEKAALAAEWNAGVDKNITTQELTKANVGTVYNDSLISFRYGNDSAKLLGTETTDESGNTIYDVSDKNCGLVILAQANDAAAEKKTEFDTYYNTAANVQKYVNYFVTGAGAELSSVKMSSAKYDDAYAFRIKATKLSRLNRADIVQALDYAKFHGGNFKVMSYYYDGSSIKYSPVTSGTLTCS